MEKFDQDFSVRHQASKHHAFMAIDRHFDHSPILQLYIPKCFLSFIPTLYSHLSALQQIWVSYGWSDVMVNLEGGVLIQLHSSQPATTACLCVGHTYGCDEIHHFSQ
jgi:hypothetical protein